MAKTTDDQIAVPLVEQTKARFPVVKAMCFYDSLPRRLGPRITPTNSSPTTAGHLSRAKNSSNSRAVSKITINCKKNGCTA
jgi:hypothetical protein